MPDKKKNRFSILLEQLLNLSEIKNAALAKALQYDVSYISKWISGRTLPAEKTSRNVLQNISLEIIRLSSKSGKENLFETYQIQNEKELEQVIFYNLKAEYDYVQDMHKLYGSPVEPKIVYFTELSAEQYISKMHHPVLRRVSRLHIMAEMDLLALAHEYRLQIVHGNLRQGPYHFYPDVHFSLVIDLSFNKINDIYDPMFLINMIADMAWIDFHLYKSERAAGRMIFAVKDDFMISGMLMDSSRCMSVAVSSDADNCNPIYDSIHDLCTREMLLYHNVTMAEMMTNNDYMRSILALHQRWIIGHMTEHFLPEDLFEELLEQVKSDAGNQFDEAQLRYFHVLIQKAAEETEFEILLNSMAFSDLALESEMDFFNHKIHLTLQQKARYIKNLLKLCAERENLKFKLICKQLVYDHCYDVTQCIFLSDEISYLRLNTQNGRNNLAVLDHPDMKMIFERYFFTIWSSEEEYILSDRKSICSFIRQIIHRIDIIASAEKRTAASADRTDEGNR